jgi:nicotinamide-nucleotide amidase
VHNLWSEAAGDNSVIMQPIAIQIHNLLLKNSKTIAAAESCTGGLFSSLLTQNPGSSGYFILGIVAYSNKSKENILNIPAKLIAAKGAVSKEVALNMAQSIRKIAKADFGIGITGIAGPTGGTLQKPVGTVFTAISSKTKTICKKLNFSGSRTAVRNKAALSALELLKKFL